MTIALGFRVFHHQGTSIQTSEEVDDRVGIPSVPLTGSICSSKPQFVMERALINYDSKLEKLRYNRRNRGYIRRHVRQVIHFNYKSKAIRLAEVLGLNGNRELYERLETKFGQSLRPYFVMGLAEANRREVWRQVVEEWGSESNLTLRGAARGGHHELIREMYITGGELSFGLLGAAEAGRIDSVEIFLNAEHGFREFILKFLDWPIDGKNLDQWEITLRALQCGVTILSLTIAYAMKLGHQEMALDLIRYGGQPQVSLEYVREHLKLTKQRRTR